jgi:hypothetical protein
MSLHVALNGKAVQVLLDESRNGLWQRIVQIDTDFPTTSFLEALTSPVVKARQARIRRLVIGSRRETLWGAFGKYWMHDAGQDVVLRQRRDGSKTVQFLLEVICVDSNCIQRSRGTSGTVTEQVLSGSNPLRFEVEGRSLSLVYFRLYPRSPGVVLFGRIEKGSIDDAQLLFGRVLERMPGLDVNLTARDDRLYFDAENIPAEFLLWEEEYPPDLSKYRCRPVAVCSLLQASGKPGCWKWSLEAQANKHE